MTTLALDAGRSRLRIHTYAEGLFARLAHDLAIEHAALEGSATRSPTGVATADLDISLAGLTVLGVLHGERVDEHGVSSSDRRDILEKMRREVFHAGENAKVRVHAELNGGAARVVLTPPGGRPVTLTVHPSIRDEDGAVHVQGTADLSLAALGSDPVKGPMGAFKVKDRVEVRFDVVFVPT